MPVKETRFTLFTLLTQSVPANRLPHQRQVKETNFFGDLIQAKSVQHLATSSLIGLPQQHSRARSSGLATNTRKDFIAVPVPRKSSKVISLPQQQSLLVEASALPDARVVPQSLFLTENDVPLNPPATPINPKTTNPLDFGDPDLSDSIIDDSVASSDDDAGLDSDPDELPLTDEVPPDVVSTDTVLTNSRDPHGPCAVTFGPVHDLHETHQGVLRRIFEKCFQFPSWFKDCSLSAWI